MSFGVLMISSQVQGPGPLQSMNTRPAVKVRYSCKSCLRQKLQSTSPIRSKEVACTFGNNFLWYILNKIQQFIHSFKERVFQASRTARDLIEVLRFAFCTSCFCLLVIVLIL